MNRDLDNEKKQLILSNDFLSSYHRIEEYFIVNDKYLTIKDKCLEKILQLFINAQNDNLEVEDVIGTDIEHFCDHFVNEFSDYSHSVILFKNLTLSGILAFLIAVVIYSINMINGKNLFAINNLNGVPFLVTYGSGVVSLLISYIVFTVLQKNRVTLATPIYYLIRFGIFAVITTGFFLIDYYTRVILTTNIYSVLVFAICMGVLWAISSYVDREGGLIGFSFKSKVYGYRTNKVNQIKINYKNSYDKLKDKYNNNGMILNVEEFKKVEKKNIKNIFIISIIFIALYSLVFLFSFSFYVVLDYSPFVLIICLLCLGIIFLLANIIGSKKIHDKIIDDLFKSEIIE